MPFYGVQFHQEKSQFETKKPGIEVINRNKESIDESSEFKEAWVEENRTSRDYGIDQAGLFTKARAYLAWNFMNLLFFGTTFESIYLFTNMSQCGVDCAPVISADDYTDSVFELYKVVHVAKSSSSGQNLTEESRSRSVYGPGSKFLTEVNQKIGHQGIIYTRPKKLMVSFRFLINNYSP